MGDPGTRPVVTLWETYGSGAAVIGAAVAAELGVAFHPQRFTSEELESAETAEGLGEGFFARVLGTLGRAASLADAGVFSGAHLTSDVADGVRAVRTLVAAGGVVVGRNATVILADVAQALHVKLDGPLEGRLARGAREAGIDLARARARQAREDAVRAEMSLRLHGWDPRETDRFDLVLNTGALRDEESVAVILAAHRVKAEARRP